MNFDLVLQNIKGLNFLAGDGESFVQATATGAHLAQKEPIQLRLYSNGIVLCDGPFRSYQEQSTQVSVLKLHVEFGKFVWLIIHIIFLMVQQCMQDLMDGYFPSELQQRFPAGVPFKVCVSCVAPWSSF